MKARTTHIFEIILFQAQKLGLKNVTTHEWLRSVQSQSILLMEKEWVWKCRLCI